jgi:hypothetical protein
VVIGAGQGMGLTNATLGTFTGGNGFSLTADQLPPRDHTLDGGGTTG